MGKVTKKAKIARFFNKNPAATIKEAATATDASYGMAWTVRKDLEAIADDVLGIPSHKTFNKWLKRDDETRYKEPATLEAKPPLVHKTQQSAGTSDGSTASYYELPDGAAELQDLISHKNMNSQIGEIFRACYRMGEASHSNELRDAKKIKFYIDAEIKRLGG
jgi:hypothetical protein